MGLFLTLVFHPPSLHPDRAVVDVADDCLAAGVNLNMLDSYGLFASTPIAQQGIHLRREGPSKRRGLLHSDGDPIHALVRKHGAPQEFQSDVMNTHHLHGQKHLEMIPRPDAGYRRKSEIYGRGLIPLPGALRDLCHKLSEEMRVLCFQQII
jgi:hypothetical protein